jgi:biopolymer transport protein ExbD
VYVTHGGVTVDKWFDSALLLPARFVLHVAHSQIVCYSRSSFIWKLIQFASHAGVRPTIKSNFMAEEIVKPELGKAKGVRPLKKLSTKIDLTPMVDLGFLLITFFILTKTLLEPKHMKMLLPAGVANTTYGKSTVLTLIPLANEKILFYNGDPIDAMSYHDYGMINPNGIRGIILKKQLALDASSKYTRADLSLIIKPTRESDFKNIITVLDEVLINELQHYSLVDLEKEDMNMLDKLSIAH